MASRVTRPASSKAMFSSILLTVPDARPWRTAFLLADFDSGSKDGLCTCDRPDVGKRITPDHEHVGVGTGGDPALRRIQPDRVRSGGGGSPEGLQWCHPDPLDQCPQRVG